MKNNNYNTHLTKYERELIEAGIKEGKTKTAIASDIGKDKSTISKEIKLHRKLSYRCPLLRECAGYKKYTHGRNCTKDCPDFVQFQCSRRDRSPGACNGCDKLQSFRFNKYKHNAVKAHKEYTETLHDTREGVNLTCSEAKELTEKDKTSSEKRPVAISDCSKCIGNQQMRKDSVQLHRTRSVQGDCRHNRDGSEQADFQKTSHG